MAILRRDGVRLFYEVHGAAGGGTPVLLTHGYSASSRMWQPNLPALALRRRLITWDIRGHGMSDSPEDPALYSEDLSVGDMLALLDAEGIDRAVVAGLSLGGYLSLAFHLCHPERVAALMLFDTGPGFRRDDARQEWNRKVERTAAGFDVRGPNALRDRPEVAGSPHSSSAGLARAARGIMAQHGPHVIDSLPKIAVPTLVVVGAGDEPFLAASEYMATRIPGARKVVIPDAGHAVNVDQPEAFNHAVVDFLETT